LLFDISDNLEPLLFNFCSSASIYNATYPAYQVILNYTRAQGIGLKTDKVRAGINAAGT
jgi:hypothetical protein